MTIIGAGCSTEPVWKGRPLSAWLGELNDLDRSRSEAADVALKHIGTNAIPFLEKRLASKPPAFGESLAEKQDEVVLAFRVLGSCATQSLPTLSVFLTNRVDLDPNPIAQSMAGLGELAKPHFVAALGHYSSAVRRAVLLGLINLGKKARDAMPSVIERLKDSDAEVRGLALFFVSELSDDRELKARSLNAGLLDSDRQVRAFAERELRKLK